MSPGYRLPGSVRDLLRGPDDDRPRSPLGPSPVSLVPPLPLLLDLEWGYGGLVLWPALRCCLWCLGTGPQETVVEDLSSAEGGGLITAPRS